MREIEDERIHANVKKFYQRINQQRKKERKKEFWSKARLNIRIYGRPILLYAAKTMMLTRKQRRKRIS